MKSNLGISAWIWTCLELKKSKQFRKAKLYNSTAVVWVLRGNDGISEQMHQQVKSYLPTQRQPHKIFVIFQFIQKILNKRKHTDMVIFLHL